MLAHAMASVNRNAPGRTLIGSHGEGGENGHGSSYLTTAIASEYQTAHRWIDLASHLGIRRQRFRLSWLRVRSVSSGENIRLIDCTLAIGNGCCRTDYVYLGIIARFLILFISSHSTLPYPI